jgi:16S rRNA (guanine966-N2)-methyltransferase
VPKSTRRIIAGHLGGRSMLPIPGQLTGVRPTSARVREAIFSRLQDEVEGARVLDLYAGTGALAIEAISRGARSATAVEANAKVARFLARQVDALGIREAITISNTPAQRFVARYAGPPFELVLADPPYDDAPAFVGVISGLVARGGLAAGAVVVFERRSGETVEPPQGLARETTRRYGDTSVEYWRYAGAMKLPD